MSIERENRFEPQIADDLKTYAIDQAELPFRRRQERGHTDRMKLGSHEFDSHNRHHVILKSPDRLHADPALKQRRCLKQNVIARHKPAVLFDDIGPRICGFSVLVIILVQNRVESGRIDKDVHRSYASARYASWFLDTSCLPDLNIPATLNARERFSSSATTLRDFTSLSMACRMTSADDMFPNAAIALTALNCSWVNWIWVLTIMPPMMTL
jgi:hypothetical protein